MTSKKINKKIKNCFKLKDGKFECEINNCGVRFKTNMLSVFKKHITRKHVVEANALGLLSENDSSNDKTNNLVKVQLPRDSVNKLFLKLITIHHLPFQSAEYEAFQEFFQPINMQLGITQNTKNLTRKMEMAFEQLKAMITEEIRLRKIVSIKFDYASRHGKSILGVNCQYIKNGKIVVRTLGE